MAGRSSSAGGRVRHDRVRAHPPADGMPILPVHRAAPGRSRHPHHRAASARGAGSGRGPGLHLRPEPAETRRRDRIAGPTARGALQFADRGICRQPTAPATRRGRALRVLDASHSVAGQFCAPPVGRQRRLHGCWWNRRRDRRSAGRVRSRSTAAVAAVDVVRAPQRREVERPLDRRDAADRGRLARPGPPRRRPDRRRRQ